MLRSTCTHAAIAEASAARKAAVLPCERMANSHLPMVSSEWWVIRDEWRVVRCEM